MTVTAKTDFTKFNKKLDNIATNGGKALVRALNLAAVMVQGDAVRSIQGGTGDKQVTRYDPKRTVTISSPGQPPKGDTGNLASNILIEPAKNESGHVVAQIRAGTPYAMALEFGFKNLEPRPFLGPAVDKNKDEIFKMISKAMQASFKKK